MNSCLLREYLTFLDEFAAWVYHSLCGIVEASVLPIRYRQEFFETAIPLTDCRHRADLKHSEPASPRTARCYC
jgi:hypothetical protein